jgi:hypothetical protein
MHTRELNQMTSANPKPISHGADAGHPKLASLIDADVIRRAGIVALILGSVLTLANQSGAVFGADTVQVLPLVLVYLTPFVVVTVSQVLGIRRALLDVRRGRASESPRGAFLATAISHGIPLRALLLGLIIGTVNTSIVVSAALMDGGDLADLPIALIGQAFVLPMLFGLVSQAISYRRSALVIGRQLQAEAQPLSI